MDAPFGSGKAEYCACPSTSRDTSFTVTRWRNDRAPAPSTSNSPMWETSNRPAAFRTAMCSLISPEYSTAMSHPPKGTILAPRARWAALRGVLRMPLALSLCSLSLRGNAFHATTRERERAMIGLQRKGLSHIGSARVIPRRGAPTEPYTVTCWNCLGEFDAMGAVWCSDDPKNPT